MLVIASAVVGGDGLDRRLGRLVPGGDGDPGAAQGEQGGRCGGDGQAAAGGAQGCEHGGLLGGRDAGVE